MFIHQKNLYMRLTKPAFTLAEIIVVVAIIGIAAAMVVPMIGDTSDIQVSAAARMIMSDIEYAQGQAMMTQSPVTVVFDTDAGTYQLQDGSGTVLTHPVNKNAFSVSLTDFGLEDTSMSQVDFAGAAQVTFDSLGAPNDSGRIVLVSDSYGLRIDLAAVTGKTMITTISP